MFEDGNLTNNIIGSMAGNLAQAQDDLIRKLLLKNGLDPQKYFNDPGQLERDGYFLIFNSDRGEMVETETGMEIPSVTKITLGKIVDSERYTVKMRLLIGGAE